MRKTLFILGSAAFVAASIAVIAAQHREGAGATPNSAAHPAFQFLHSACASHGAGHGQDARAHVPPDFAKALDLTSTQLSEIERMATEACAAMTRIHEQMMNVLTPEQRAKVHELHKSGHGGGAFLELLKKLHGE